MFLPVNLTLSFYHRRQVLRRSSLDRRIELVIRHHLQDTHKQTKSPVSGTHQPIRQQSAPSNRRWGLIPVEKKNKKNTVSSEWQERPNDAYSSSVFCFLKIQSVWNCSNYFHLTLSIQCLTSPSDHLITWLPVFVYRLQLILTISFSSRTGILFTCSAVLLYTSYIHTV